MALALDPPPVVDSVLAIAKYWDTNVNGQNDGSELPLDGFRFSVSVTDANGTTAAVPYVTSGADGTQSPSASCPSWSWSQSSPWT